LPLVNVSVVDLVVSVASEENAAGMVEVIHAAFGARPVLDPPSTASAETVESVAAALRNGSGIYAEVGDRPAGVILVLPDHHGRITFQRVSVHPDFQRHGIASAMVGAAEELAATLGHRRVELFARAELAELVAFWQHRGFAIDRPAPYGMILAKPLPLAITVPTAQHMQRLGQRLAGLLQPGDVIIASGDLGAGKTTLTQGIGAGLGSIGPIISPTFVLSRIHPSAIGRPQLVHVDAYRLGSREELDDLDLETTLDASVTVIEWGEDVAEHLADSRLELDLWTIAEHGRTVLVRPVGPRWQGVDLGVLNGVARD
jgi:tRNA threonylcarbamoyladenosine biosynthesis protein TsaE